MHLKCFIRNRLINIDPLFNSVLKGHSSGPFRGPGGGGDRERASSRAGERVAALTVPALVTRSDLYRHRRKLVSSPDHLLGGIRLARETTRSFGAP